jgi:hypothetical protein
MLMNFDREYRNNHSITIEDNTILLVMHEAQFILTLS